MKKITIFIFYISILLYTSCKNRNDSSLQNTHGKSVSAEQFPWLASIEDSDGNHACNGTFISKKTLITAGHCQVGLVRGVAPRFSLFFPPLDAQLLVFDKEMVKDFRLIDFDYEPQPGDELQITTFDAYTRGEFKNPDLFDGKNWIDGVTEGPAGTEIQISYSADPKDGVGLDSSNSGTAAFYRGRIIDVLSNKAGPKINFAFLGSRKASVKALMEYYLPKLEHDQPSLTTADSSRIHDHAFKTRLDKFALEKVKNENLCDQNCTLFYVENFTFRGLTSEILQMSPIGNATLFGTSQHVSQFGKDQAYQGLLYLDEDSSKDEILNALAKSDYDGVFILKVDQNLLEIAKIDHMKHGRFNQDNGLMRFLVHKQTSRLD